MKIGYLICGMLLGAGFVLSVSLSVQYVFRVGLPGCSVDGACAELTALPWGRPARLLASFSGAGYFAALLTVWAMSGVGVSRDVRFFARSGAAVSVVLTGVMIESRHLCFYCLATHGVNLAVWALVEWSPRLPGVRMSTLVAASTVFPLVLGALYSVETRMQPALDAGVVTDDILTASAPQGGKAKNSKLPVLPTRFVLGPRDALVQLVIYGDYQCRFCREMDAEARRLVEMYPGSVSLVVKHYPLCAECNPRVAKDVHADACRAARAVEAAGSLKGNDGFWKMHDWLSQRSGLFGDGELRKALVAQGYENADAFFRAMHSDSTLEPIQQDVAEAQALSYFNVETIPIVVANGMLLPRTGGKANLKNAVEAALKEGGMN